MTGPGSASSQVCCQRDAEKIRTLGRASTQSSDADADKATRGKGKGLVKL